MKEKKDKTGYGEGERDRIRKIYKKKYAKQKL